VRHPKPAQGCRRAVETKLTETKSQMRTRGSAGNSVEGAKKVYRIAATGTRTAQFRERTDPRLVMVAPHDGAPLGTAHIHYTDGPPNCRAQDRAPVHEWTLAQGLPPAPGFRGTGVGPDICSRRTRPGSTRRPRRIGCDPPVENRTRDASRTLCPSLLRRLR